MTLLALFDIDGCCLDPEDRLHHFHSGDYDMFKSQWRLDKPIPQGVVVYKQLMQQTTLKCVFLTSRGEDQRETTERQLKKLFPGCEYELWMQNQNNRKPCQVYKVEAILSRGYKPENVFIAFDDHTEVINAYRELGIIAYQTAPRND